MPSINDTIFFVNREQEERHTEEAAKKLNLPYANLINYPLTKEVLAFVDEATAAKLKIIPYLKVGKVLKLGAVNPNDENLKKFIEDYKTKQNTDVSLTVISNTSFMVGLNGYEKLKDEEKKKQEEEKEEDFTAEVKGLESVASVVKKVNTTQLLDVILAGAMKSNSSDVHFEPAENDLLIRYRIDGTLQDVVRLTLLQYKNLISRIKFLSKLRMDISDKPQDGRFSFTPSDQDTVDLRVSIMPSTFGESIVLRLLGQEKSILTLDNLGFRPDALAIIKKTIRRPYGMILTSGPTGSGKTSTLYAILMGLKKPGVKIITLENPVEYRMEGIEQSQIKPGQGYEFSDGLKASLRQDPDILMVGEIRDPDTAEIAVQASITGHLLLSTIHANNASSVYPRLLEIGIKPFLLSGAINLIMAQRLVRKLCQKCREEYTPEPSLWQEARDAMLPIKDKLAPEIQKILLSDSPKLVKSKGCKECNNTGFSGRAAIIEVLVPDEKIEALVSKNGSIVEFAKAAAEQGMITMEHDGLSKALLGLTTIEEVWRVTKG